MWDFHGFSAAMLDHWEKWKTFPQCMDHWIVWEAVVHAFAASRQTGQKSQWFITDYLSSLLV